MVQAKQPVRKLHDVLQFALSRVEQELAVFFGVQPSDSPGVIQIELQVRPLVAQIGVHNLDKFGQRHCYLTSMLFQYSPRIMPAVVYMYREFGARQINC